MIGKFTVKDILADSATDVAEFVNCY